MEPIAHGPMASVYRARWLANGVVVACKILAPERPVGARAAERFLREIEVMKGLRHGALVTLLATGVSRGRLYLVMPLCEGGDLDARVLACGGVLSVEEATGHMVRALEGLAHMHARSLVHRDVKPSNILLDGAGHAMLADFGIAKSFVDAGMSDLTSSAGTPVGTPGFMAREQVTNFRFVHPVTDVWAAGATLYFLLTGRTPRAMTTHRSWREAILSSPVVPIRVHAPDLPASLAKVVDRALEERVEDRYPDAAGLLSALRRAGGGARG